MRRRQGPLFVVGLVLVIGSCLTMTVAGLLVMGEPGSAAEASAPDPGWLAPVEYFGLTGFVTGMALLISGPLRRRRARRRSAVQESSR